MSDHDQCNNDFGPVQIEVGATICIRGLEAKPRAMLRAMFRHANPFYWQAHKRNPYTSEEPIIETCVEKEDVLECPRGGLCRVLEALPGVEVLDRRSLGQGPALKAHHHVELRSYQEALLEPTTRAEQGILRAPTGSGKTTLALALLAKWGRPGLVIVSTAGLYAQWIERVQKEFGFEPEEIGLIQGPALRLRPITVGIQKSVLKYANAKTEVGEEVRNYFGVVIADEVHQFGAKTFLETINPFPARYRIGVSADHRRRDEKEFLLYDAFGEVISEIKRDELVVQNHILDVAVEIVETEFRAAWYQAQRLRRQDAYAQLIEKLSVDKQRTILLADEIKRGLDEEETLLVLARTRDLCERIHGWLEKIGVKSGLLIGKDSKLFKQSVKALKERKIRVGVGTYQAVGTGIDLPRVGLAIAATPIAGNEQFFNQVRGRVCRTSEGKKNARLVYLWDKYVFPSHDANIRRWCKTVRNRNSQLEIL